MNRKDYELIAGAIAQVRENIGGRWHNDAELALDSVITRLADELEGTNPRFDYGRFMTAAGHHDWQTGEEE